MLWKEDADVCAKPITDIFVSCIDNGNFLHRLRMADISPISNAVDNNAKENYRPVSILDSVSKLFEKSIQQQLHPFFDKKLNDRLCGYRKGPSAQYAGLNLIENRKNYCDTKGYSVAVLMDLSKAFDKINHDLLITKLHGRKLTHADHEVL